MCLRACFGPPCPTFAVARAASGDGRHALRSWRFVDGKPGLSSEDQQLVDSHNRLLAFTCELIALMLEAGGEVVLEQPADRPDDPGP